MKQRSLCVFFSILVCAALLLTTAFSQRKPQTRNTATATQKGAPRAGSIVRNSMGMEFAYWPAGGFMMGGDRYDSEKPIHRVVFRKGFYVERYEVTQAQGQAIIGVNGSTFKGCDNCPAENVSWNGAQEFIRKLNARGDGFEYRLPSEAEWEYACRAGTATNFAFGNGLSSAEANFDGNIPYGGAPSGVSRGKTTPVGSFRPDAWGLHDMHGNVLEWCEDVWHDNYDGAPRDGSAWLSDGNENRRVVRGGSWNKGAIALRSAARFGDGISGPDLRYGSETGRFFQGCCGDPHGFRVVATPLNP